ncbi:MAG TPA: metal ABC transporter substrate-binding protein [Thermoleophilaceae bacterium]|nr:metal ABC transporter substrate-binding protein [Thermoleophilaceae bacterium]
MHTPTLLLLVLALGLAVAGCGDDAEEGGGGEVGAVATTTIVGDLVRSVGGERVHLDTLVPADADPHDHEPRPSDAIALSEADIVVKSGGELDEWLDELVESAGGDAAEVTLLDSVEAIEGGHAREEGDPPDGDIDPHWWQDPRNAILAVEAVRDALAGADPAGRRAYERSAAAYTRGLRALDLEIERCIQRVPPRKRKLVTTHDSLGYFAERYGVEVIGSVIPSLSTQAQPSARDVDALVDQIQDEGVEAIFPEVAVSQRLERAISRESGAEVGRELWTDSLGGEGSGAETYVDAMRANANALAEGMSGGRVSCGG